MITKDDTTVETRGSDNQAFQNDDSSSPPPPPIAAVRVKQDQPSIVIDETNNSNINNNDTNNNRDNDSKIVKSDQVIDMTPDDKCDKFTDVQLRCPRDVDKSVLPQVKGDDKSDRVSTVHLEDVTISTESINDRRPSGEGSRRSSLRKSFNMMRRKSIDRVKLTFNSYRGIVLAMSSSIFFTFTAVIVKYLKDIHPGQMACFRFLGILLFTIPMIITAGVNPLGPKEKRHLLLLRGLAGATSLYLRYSALHYLPIANATVIILSMPVFVCVFARIFLKEPCGIFHVVSIGVTLVGIGFTANIPAMFGMTSEDDSIDRSREIIGLVYSMGATLIGASVYIFVRKVKECHNSVILFNFAVVAIVETSILTGLDNGFSMPTDPMVPWLLIILATLSFYAQLLLTKALQMEEASLVSVTRSSAEVVCAFVFQIIIFQQIPSLNAFIGALFVTSSVLLTSARKWVITLPSNHLARKILGFTLK